VPAARIPRWRFRPHQVVALGFLFLILVGTFFLSLPLSWAKGRSLTPLQALFTAASAVCVTGLSVVDIGSTFNPFGQVVILLLIQAGGLGVMTSAALFSLLLGRRIGLPERLALGESLGELPLAGIVRLARRIFITSLVFEALGTLLLTSRFLPFFPPFSAVYYALFHSVSAFNNAGLTLFPQSLERFRGDPVVNLVMMALIVSGGLGFTVLVELGGWAKALWKRERFRFSLHARLVLITTGLLIGGGFLLVLFLERGNPQSLGSLPWGERILAALFAAITPRTAGFDTVSPALFRETTLFLTLLLMFVGASPGGTGGGIKTTTLATLVLAVWSAIQGRDQVEAFGRTIRREAVFRSLTVFTASSFWVVVVSLVLGAREPFPFLSVLFETVSAFGTVGLSLGLTPHLSSLSLLLLVLTMYLGRIGPMTLPLALAGRRRERFFSYPEERIIIG